MGEAILSKIFISVGHGGTDPGCIAVDGSYEKDIALKIALYLRDELQRHNVEVKMSREIDEQDKVADETAECNAYKPDYGVSIHCNASTGHDASGFEVWHSINPNSKGVCLATNINNCILDAGYKSRGLKTRKNSSNKDYLAWIRNTTAPVVLCEVGFIDNKENYTLLDSETGKKKMAVTISKGILDIVGIKYVPIADVIENNKLYAVQCGSFSKKENANALAEKLKNDGYSAIVIEK